VPRADNELGCENPSNGVYLAAPAEGDVTNLSSSELSAAIPRHDEAAITSMVLPQAARMLLLPTATEYSVFASDYLQLCVSPLITASVSWPRESAEDASSTSMARVAMPLAISMTGLTRSGKGWASTALKVEMTNAFALLSSVAAGSRWWDRMRVGNGL
jgi:hypothetical protein